MEQLRHQAAVDWLKKQFSACRQETVKESQKSARPSRIHARLGAWWGLRKEIESAQEAVGSLLAQSVHLQLDDFGARRVI